jgi:hypothetical protein
MSLDIKNPPAAQSPAIAAWESALASMDTNALLRINGMHVASFPTLAPALADLVRELRFSDLSVHAKAAFVIEVLIALRLDGAVAARVQCQRAITQLEREYAQRHNNLPSPNAAPAVPHQQHVGRPAASPSPRATLPQLSNSETKP